MLRLIRQHKVPCLCYRYRLRVSHTRCALPQQERTDKATDERIYGVGEGVSGKTRGCNAECDQLGYQHQVGPGLVKFATGPEESVL